jgi:two-component system, cell cycle response regulator
MERPSSLRFINDLARELRAAVSLIREHADMLADGRRARVREVHRQSIKLIQRQICRLDRLIDELDARFLGDVAIRGTPLRPAVDTRRPLPRILIADDDADALDLLAALLAERYEVEKAHDGLEALARMRAEEFDLVILDQQMPGLSGLEVAEQFVLEGRPPVSFMFLSAEQRPAIRARGLSLGAADFVMKPIDPEELLARVVRIVLAVQRERSLTSDALSDPLTGLANYRSLARNLDLELERAQRYDLPLSLLTIDLDDLKGINDELGHGAGNDAIRLVASVLEGAVRRFETVARQVGDELSILLPNANEAEALQLGERLRHGVAERNVRGRSLSISIGVASREPGDEPTSVRKLVDASDKALYFAKRSGRNRVSACARR